MENRYLFQHSIKNLPMSRYDALIIGGGIAGLFAALHMDPSMHCAVATKLALDQSNSALAQGGIASVITPDDKLEWHIHDTLVAGAIRTVAGMESALLRLAELRNLTKNMVLETRQEYELYNMIDVALEVLNGALARKESVGAHYVVG